jgi:hypothetical protein
MVSVNVTITIVTVEDFHVNIYFADIQLAFLSA